MGAIKVHHTGMSEGGWDGPANEARLKLDQDAAFYSRAYAWRDGEGDETKKSSYKFIHHEVDADGNPGAANMRACSTGIGVLNGGRGGTTIPEGDRQGVYSHLAAHLRDGDMEPPEMKGKGQDEREERTFLVLIRAGSEGDAPKIEGVAAVYNQPALIETYSGSFMEEIEPGFFENVLGNDARALWNHNTDLVLGRVKAGTLRLEDSSDGLSFAVDPPATQWGRDAVVSISRGDVDQCSFAFSVKPGGDEWKSTEGGMLTRVLKRGGCAELYDVSPVTFPAYPQTSVAVRSEIQRFSEMANQRFSDSANRGIDNDGDPNASGSPNGDAGQATQIEAERAQAQRRLRAKNRKRKLEIKSKF